jgi:hypothetical protein
MNSLSSSPSTTTHPRHHRRHHHHHRRHHHHHHSRHRRSSSPSSSHRHHHRRHHHHRSEENRINRKRDRCEEEEEEERRRARRRRRHEQRSRSPREEEEDDNNFTVIQGRSERVEGRRDILKIEYWERTPEMDERKQDHMDRLDSCGEWTREEIILSTTLRDVEIAIEPNMFPYETPAGISHWTLWSRKEEVSNKEIEIFVEEFLNRNMPQINAWQYDPSNLFEGMSINLYHVHVYFHEPIPIAPLKVDDSNVTALNPAFASQKIG